MNPLTYLRSLPGSVWGMFALLIVAGFLLSGCATYERMYGQYAAAASMGCSAGPKPLIEFTDSGGSPIKVYQEDKGCDIAPPDNPGRIVADTTKSLAGTAVKGLIGFKGLDEIGSTMREGFRRAGPQVGGDGVIGSDNQDIFTDKTSPPTVVEPTIVEVPTIPPVEVPAE